ncbi:MAG: Holliday junction branch migration protein RuvA [Endomicrobium sp.]|uniref:Holliday junction branch migration protein RuvA n=1 Tax=Candidatus Endomicrobiellum pyrsonymphae TaxID=1408203 RepID=UPI003572626B|nr:Holliday junction branch migration protein RuvA [Endomicrobium sp.]
MIDYLCGTLNSKSTNSVTVDVNGIGYSIAITMSSFSKLPEIGSAIKVYVAEAVAGIYGGVVYLYGFLSKEEREMYLLIKDEVPGTGAKKAMEYVDKISKSFADFKTAVITKNPSMLNGIFGFTKKTADKLIAALKDKIVAVNTIGQEKWSGIKINENSIFSDAIEGLVALGYKEQQARVAVTKTYEHNENIALEDLIKKSLQDL